MNIDCPATLMAVTYTPGRARRRDEPVLYKVALKLKLDLAERDSIRQLIPGMGEALLALTDQATEEAGASRLVPRCPRPALAVNLRLNHMDATAHVYLEATLASAPALSLGEESTATIVLDASVTRAKLTALMGLTKDLLVHAEPLQGELFSGLDEMQRLADRDGWIIEGAVDGGESTVLAAPGRKRKRGAA